MKLTCRRCGGEIRQRAMSRRLTVWVHADPRITHAALPMPPETESELRYAHGDR